MRSIIFPASNRTAYESLAGCFRAMIDNKPQDYLRCGARCRNSNNLSALNARSEPLIDSVSAPGALAYRCSNTLSHIHSSTTTRCWMLMPAVAAEPLRMLAPGYVPRWTMFSVEQMSASVAKLPGRSPALPAPRRTSQACAKRPRSVAASSSGATKIELAPELLLQEVVVGAEVGLEGRARDHAQRDGVRVGGAAACPR